VVQNVIVARTVEKGQSRLVLSIHQEVVVPAAIWCLATVHVLDPNWNTLRN